MAQRSYCAEVAVDEPMAGTADVLSAWLLVEYRPTWQAKAVVDNDLSQPVRRWLTAQSQLSRVQFIRRPEHTDPGISLFHATAAGMRRFVVEAYEQLLDLDLQTGGDPVTSPQFFVCTNGQRDRCCARFGLPAYAALRAQRGGNVWQTTHVGGHRFAPNVLVLPHGDVYGRVSPADVPRFLQALEQGVAFDWLRGSSFEPAAVQAARAFARIAPSQRADAEHMGADRWRVRFDGGALVECELEAARLVIASCDDVPKAVRSWRLIRTQP